MNRETEKQEISVATLGLGMGDPFSLSSFWFSINIFFFVFPQVLVAANGETNNLTQPSFTPINYDLYHSSGNLMEEIKALVHRHPDKLTMETINARNKGYGAEVMVVTYCQGKRENHERSKFRILLMVPCLPEFWATWKGADYLRTCFKDFVNSK